MATITQEVDITTAEGKQQASSGKSSLSLYLQQMGNRQREAFEKVYYATVDQPCSQPCMMTCDTDMDRFLIPCRQPLTFLHFFEENRQHEEQDTMDFAPAGAYVVPISCEYCGSNTTTLCPSNCRRPKLFFRKQRPPFIPQSESWDRLTEYELPKSRQPSWASKSQKTKGSR